MDLHKNARSCPASRALLVRRVLEEGWTVRRPLRPRASANARHIDGLPGIAPRVSLVLLIGLRDRTEFPGRHRRSSSKDRFLRLRRMSGAEISSWTGSPRSTVARWLNRVGLGRLRQLAPPEPIRRYEKEHPGELLHLDIKKLGKIRGVGHRITGDKTKRARGIGWEFVHVCIDDASRVSYVEVLDDEKGPTASAFLRRAIAWFAARGVETKKILTDNGSCYVSKYIGDTCSQLKIKHNRTRPYTPRTNRQSQTVHPNSHQRVGVRIYLLYVRRSCTSPAEHTTLLQPSSSAFSARWSATCLQAEAEQRSPAPSTASVG